MVVWMIRRYKADYKLYTMINQILNCCAICVLYIVWWHFHTVLSFHKLPKINILTRERSFRSPKQLMPCDQMLHLLKIANLSSEFFKKIWFLVKLQVIFLLPIFLTLTKFYEAYSLSWRISFVYFPFCTETSMVDLLSTGTRSYYLCHLGKRTLCSHQ